VVAAPGAVGGRPCFDGRHGRLASSDPCTSCKNRGAHSTSDQMTSRIYVEPARTELAQSFQTNLIRRIEPTNPQPLFRVSNEDPDSSARLNYDQRLIKRITAAQIRLESTEFAIASHNYNTAELENINTGVCGKPNG